MSTFWMLISCVTPNDAGEEAFAHQAIELVLGRKPLGSGEVRALADLSVARGRPAVLDALFARPEYVAYWTNVLMDDLQVARTGPTQVAPDCLAPPVLRPHRRVGLAYHLVTAPPEVPFCDEPLPQLPAGLRPDAFLGLVEDFDATYPFDRLADVDEPELLPVFPQADPVEPDWMVTPSAFTSVGQQGAIQANRDFYPGGDSPWSGMGYDADRWQQLADEAGLRDCAPFNLTDVVDGAVRADRLDAMYRGYLPVMATFPGTGDDSEMRDQLGSTFLDVYLDRDPTCMGCHNALYSTTNPRPLNANWDRFVPIGYGLPWPLDLEGTVFSYDVGAGDFVYGGMGGRPVRQRVGRFFRSDNHDSSRMLPWGFDEACVTNPEQGFDGFARVLPSDPLSSADGGGDAAFAGVGPADTVGVLQLADALADGTATMTGLSMTLPDWAAYRSARGAVSPGVSDCGSCHTATSPRAPSLARVTPTMTDRHLFDVIRFGSGEMPPRATDDATAWGLVQWVRDTYPVSVVAPELRDRAHGFVLLLSANVVNQVLDEVLGEPFVLDHGFPRNAAQAQNVSALTLTFAERFSLQDLLEGILLSDLVNRRAPEEPGTEPYVLPMLPYPEAAVPPGTSPAPLGGNANSEGDFVHKHSPSGLLHQVHHALGWPAPRPLGDPEAYPSQPLMEALGRHASPAAREREAFAVDLFLTWSREVASCQKPDVVVAREVTLDNGLGVDPQARVGPDAWIDYIDVLVDEATARHATWETIVVLLKDRLLTDPTLTAGERGAVEDVLEAALDTSPLDDGVLDDQEQERLRVVCGALMASPQFVLRGQPLSPALPEALPDPVCMPGEPCGQGGFSALYAGQDG